MPLRSCSAIRSRQYSLLAPIFFPTLALVMAPLWGFPDHFVRGVPRTLTINRHSWFYAARYLGHELLRCAGSVFLEGERTVIRDSTGSQHGESDPWHQPVLSGRALCTHLWARGVPARCAGSGDGTAFFHEHDLGVGSTCSSAE